MAAHNLRESLRDVASFSQLMAETYAARLDSDGALFLESYPGGGGKNRSRLLAGVVDYWAAGTGARAVLPDGHGSGPSPGAPFDGHADNRTERERYP